MLRVLSIFIALAGLFAPAAGAQGNQARATYYQRVQGDKVHAAVVVRITSDWYLYHTDPGSDFGKPLQVTFGADGTGWTVEVPEPHVGKVDDEFLGKYTYNYHTGLIVLHATGDTSEGASADDELSLAGLTCSNVTGLCIDYLETVEAKDAGKDKYWEGWPASLGAVPAAAPIEDPGDTAPDVAQPGGTEPENTTPGVVGPPITTEPGGQEGGPSINPFGSQKVEKVTPKLYVRIDEQANRAKLVLVVDIAEGYYVYNGPNESDLGHPDFGPATPTTIEVFDDSYAIDWGEPTYSKPKRKEGDDDSPWYWQHQDQLVISVEGTIVEDPDGAEIYVEFTYQVCDERMCDPQETVVVESEGEGDDEYFQVKTWGSGELDGTKKESSLWKFLLSAVGWGLFTLLMPCTYPMIPITISFFTKQAEARGGKVLNLSITYGLGIVAVFILIGLVFAPVIVPFASHWVTNLVIGSLFLFFSFVLFGWVNLQPPAALNNMASKAAMSGGYIGVFLMGATLVVTSFTCTAPFVGTLLGSAATGGESDYLRVILGMGVFGLTMATPFVFLSLVPGKMQAMPQAGEWMNTLKVFLGYVELAAALKFISNADIVLKWGLVSREVFLIAWCVIFIAAGVYLVRKALATRAAGGARGGRQIYAGVLSMVFGLYCGYGVPGNRLDNFIMTPLLPPYENWWEVDPDLHVVIKDDWDGALQRALDESKLVLVNFTGFT